MYTLSTEKTRPGPESCTNKDGTSEINVRRVTELKALGPLNTYFHMLTFLNVFHLLPSLCISGFYYSEILKNNATEVFEGLFLKDLSN